MVACVLCEPFSAHKAYQMGVLTDVVPALKVDGKFVANPTVETQRMVDEFGRNVYGEPKTGAALEAGKALMKKGTVDLSLLDAGGRAVRQDAADLPRLHHQDDRGTAQAQARRLEPQQGKLARLAGAEHDDRGALGFTAFNEGPRTTARSTSCCCARSWPPARAGWAACTTRSSPRRRSMAEASSSGPLPPVALERDGAGCT